MYCKDCGNLMEDESGICKQCNPEQSQPEAQEAEPVGAIAEPGMPEAEPVGVTAEPGILDLEPKKKSKLPFIIGGVVAGIGVIAATAFLFVWNSDEMVVGRAIANTNEVLEEEYETLREEIPAFNLFDMYSKDFYGITVGYNGIVTVEALHDAENQKMKIGVDAMGYSGNVVVSNEAITVESEDILGDTSYGVDLVNLVKDINANESFGIQLPSSLDLKLFMDYEAYQERIELGVEKINEDLEESILIEKVGNEEKTINGKTINTKIYQLSMDSEVLKEATMEILNLAYGDKEFKAVYDPWNELSLLLSNGMVENTMSTDQILEYMNLEVESMFPEGMVNCYLGIYDNKIVSYEVEMLDSTNSVLVTFNPEGNMLDSVVLTVEASELMSPVTMEMGVKDKVVEAKWLDEVVFFYDANQVKDNVMVNSGGIEYIFDLAADNDSEIEARMDIEGAEVIVGIIFDGIDTENFEHPSDYISIFTRDINELSEEIGSLVMETFMGM